MTRFDDTTLLGRGQMCRVHAYEAGKVIKIFPPQVGDALVRNEFLATTIAGESGLPSPRAYELTSVGDGSAIVLERLEGKTLLAQHGKAPLRLLRALRQAARIHASIHRHPAHTLQRQRAILERQIDRSRVSETVRRAAHRALGRLTDGDQLCHGDFHPSNIMCTRDGLRVIDWYNACRGAPAADVATTAFIIRFHGPRISRAWSPAVEAAVLAFVANWYVRHYRAATGLPLSAIRDWQLPAWVAAMPRNPSPHDEEANRQIERLLKAEERRGLVS